MQFALPSATPFDRLVIRPCNAVSYVFHARTLVPLSHLASTCPFVAFSQEFPHVSRRFHPPFRQRADLSAGPRPSHAGSLCGVDRSLSVLPRRRERTSPCRGHRHLRLADAPRTSHTSSRVRAIEISPQDLDTSPRPIANDLESTEAAEDGGTSAMTVLAGTWTVLRFVARALPAQRTAPVNPIVLFGEGGPIRRWCGSVGLQCLVVARHVDVVVPLRTLQLRQQHTCKRGVASIASRHSRPLATSRVQKRRRRSCWKPRR